MIWGFVSAGVLLGAIVLPFLPGPYDPLAPILFAAATATAFGSLVLVPIGFAWLFAPRGQYVIAKTAVLVAAILAVLVGLATAAGDGSVTAAAAMLVGGLTVAVGIWRRIRAAQSARLDLSRAIPLALIAVPLIVLLGRQTVAERLMEWSRDRVVSNAGAMIADIERFRDRTGVYPVAISSLHPDYKPGIMGVERFRYERSGQGYNLYFEHVSTIIGAQEIVMYNPRGEQDISSHAMDLLQLSEADITRQRGHFAAYNLSQKGWRRFLFD